MMRSLRFAAVIPLFALVACSHEGASPPPTTGTTQTTSASIDTGVPPDAQNRFIEHDRVNVTPPPRHTVAAMSQWGARYPDAARLLGQWIEQHPQTAVKLADWERKNPERLRVLVDWASTHEYESLGAFLFNRAGWDDLRQIQSDDPDAFHGFLTWVRSAPPAARELAMHPEALAYADQHWGEYERVDTTKLAAAHRQRAKPSRGPQTPNESAGNPQVSRTTVTSARVTAPPAKQPAEPKPADVPPPAPPDPLNEFPPR